jgi:hypothetical protein
MFVSVWQLMCEPIDENHAKSLQNSYPPAKKPGDFAFYGTFDE